MEAWSTHRASGLRKHAISVFRWGPLLYCGVLTAFAAAILPGGRGVLTNGKWYVLVVIFLAWLAVSFSFNMLSWFMYEREYRDYERIKRPNQLPDPTSPSVTPPAGAGGAPSVTADH
jgi:hypothetical protein